MILETQDGSVPQVFSASKGRIFIADIIVMKLVSIDLPRQLDGTYEIGMKSKDDELISVYVNPYRGKILGSRRSDRALMSIVYDFHYNLLAGDVGEKVVGVCGLLLLLLGVSGIIVWPGWKRFATGYHIRWHSPKKLVNYDIHKVAGILSVVFLIVIASTGAGMIFYTQAEQTIYWLTGTVKPAPPKSTLVAKKPPVSMDKVLQKADAALRGAKTTYVFLLEKPDGAIARWQEISPGSFGVRSESCLS